MYDWERENVREDPTGLSLEQIADVVRWCRAQYGIKPGDPKVIDGRGSPSARWSAWRGYEMPRWSRKERVILHEAAHEIIAERWKQDHADHGREFVRVYAMLCVRRGLIDGTAAMRSLRAARVRIAPTTKAPKILEVRAVGRAALIRQRLAALEAERVALTAELAMIKTAALPAAADKP